MSDGLELSVFSEVEETIDTRVHGDASGVVMCGSECSECLCLNIFHHSCIRIVLLFCLAEEPVHTVGDTRCDIDVFQQCEIRKTDLEVVCHTILELVPEAWLVELRCLEVDPVLQRGVVAEGEFFVETLLTDSVLSFERIESAHRECDVRQCERV